MRKTRLVCLLAALCGLSAAQTVHNGNFQVLGSFDVSSGTWSKPVPIVTSDPSGSCSNAAAVVLNTSAGAQSGHLSACINGTWALLNNTSNASMSLTGDVTGTASNGVISTTVGKLNGTALSSLSGLTKWLSGQPVSAAYGDIVSLFGSGSCAGLLNSDGSCLSFTLPLSVANGGTGTSSPGLIAGTNVTVTGSWPNQTISATGGGSSGTSAVQFAPTYASGAVTFGSCSTGSPCYLAPNGILDTYTATPVVQPATGTANDTLWVYGVPGSNTVQVGYNSANTYSCQGCTLVTSTSAIPNNAYGLYSCSVTSGQINSGGCTPTSTAYTNTTLNTGMGVAAVKDPTTGAISLNTYRNPRKVGSGTSETLSNSDCGGVVAYSVASGAFSVTIPQAGLGNQFVRGCDIWLVNYGAATVSFTPAGSSSFNGATGAQTLAAGSASAPTTAYITSDGSNYYGAILSGGGAGGGSWNGGTITTPITINANVGGLINLTNTTGTASQGINFINAGNTQSWFAGSNSLNQWSLYDGTHSTTRFLLTNAGASLFNIGAAAVDSEVSSAPTSSEWYSNASTGNVLLQINNANSGWTGNADLEFKTSAGAAYIGAGGPSASSNANTLFAQVPTSGTVMTIPYATGVVQFSRAYSVGVNNISCSGTCTLDLSKGDQYVSLTGSVTSSTFTNMQAGMHWTMHICQPSGGGMTFAPPSSALGFTTIGTTSSKCSDQSYWSPNGTLAYATAPGVINQ